MTGLYKIYRNDGVFYYKDNLLLAKKCNGKMELYNVPVAKENDNCIIIHFDILKFLSI